MLANLTVFCHKVQSHFEKNKLVRRKKLCCLWYDTFSSLLTLRLVTFENIWWKGSGITTLPKEGRSHRGMDLGREAMGIDEKRMLMWRGEQVIVNVWTCSFLGNAWNLYCWWINLTRADSCREARRVGLRHETRHKKEELSKLLSLYCCLIISFDKNIIEERFMGCTHFSSSDNWMLNAHRAHLPDIWSPSKSGSRCLVTNDFSSLPVHASFPPWWWTSNTWYTFEILLGKL